MADAPVGGGATIFALSSGRGRAGVAVFRVSGAQAGAALQALAGALPAARKAELRTLRHPDSGEPLDQALVLWFPAPHSFTGEDVSELHVHGGRAVIEAVAEALQAVPGLRPAEAGAFARRAFDSGKLDLTEVEGLADLINAETEAQRRQALRQSEGGLGRLYEGWRDRLVEALALIEAALDFADEADVPAAVDARARPLVEALAAQMTRHLDDSHRGERLRDGFRVVLAGPPNVGKSSLLNALARRDAAIVSEEAGTTRDVIEVYLDLGGYPVIVVDTAGLRESSGAIETEGIRRTLARAEDADLILWLVDAANAAWELPAPLKAREDQVMPVLNKADLIQSETEGKQVLTISARTGAGLDLLTRVLETKAGEALTTGEAPALTRSRHRAELEAALAALGAFLEGDRNEVELRAEDLRQAATALGRVTGRVDVEDILDRVFGEFCIGK